jgi:hypothetical protein
MTTPLQFTATRIGALAMALGADTLYNSQTGQSITLLPSSS